MAMTMIAIAVYGGPAKRGIEYNRDIQPILSENCFSCHGTDSAARKANLRLDRFRPPPTNWKTARWRLCPANRRKAKWSAGSLPTDDDHMPPAKVNKVLKPEQKELLKKWIAAGAKYQPHWSFIAAGKKRRCRR